MADAPPGNLLTDLPPHTADEAFATIVTRPGIRIERIVSTGQATPPDAPLVQAHDEWVLLLAGAAALWIDGAGERRLVPGDHALVPAGRAHRVTFTHDGPTIWLAAHFGG